MLVDSCVTKLCLMVVPLPNLQQRLLRMVGVVGLSCSSPLRPPICCFVRAHVGQYCGYFPSGCHADVGPHHTAVSQYSPMRLLPLTLIGYTHHSVAIDVRFRTMSTVGGVCEGSIAAVRPVNKASTGRQLLFPGT